jgi:hypothetical protein
VNGTIESMRSKAEIDALVDPLLTQEQIKDIAEKAMAQEIIGGCLNDPKGLLADAIGRFEQVPERESTKKRARDLIREHQLVDPGEQKVRFIVPSEPNMDVVIVLHPQPDTVKGVLGEDIQVDRYLVFGREYQGTKRMQCFACINARKRGRKAGPHTCYARRTWEDWEPMVFAWAHGLDHAEDLAKELRSAWQATAEQKYGDNNRNWSAETEIPFSGDWMAGYQAGRGGSAWSTQS